MEEFDNCSGYKFEDYQNDGIDYTCPACDDIFYWDSEARACLVCGDDMRASGCNNCIAVDECTECFTGLVLNPTKTLCMLPLDNCAVEPKFYEVKWLYGEAFYVCPECNENYYWSG